MYDKVFQVLIICELSSRAAKRCGVDGLRVLISSLFQSDHLGVGIAQVLSVKRRQRAKELAQKAPRKMVFPMVFLIVPAMYVIILGPAIPTCSVRSECPFVL